MARNPSAVVRRTLQAYADRGVFRAFSEVGGRGGRTEYKFLWLTPVPFHLVFEPRRGSLTFRNLLPNIPADSLLYGDLKSFVKGWYSTELPAHRRIDSRRVLVKYSNKAGSVSITFKVLRNQYAYGVKKAVNQVSELFLSFLNLHHFDYMVENFELAEE